MNQNYLPQQNQLSQNNIAQQPNPQTLTHQTLKPLLKCLCLTIIIQNIIYLLNQIRMNVILSMNSINYLFILQTLFFIYFLYTTKNTPVSEQYYNKIKKIFVCSFITYTIIFALVFIFLVVDLKNLPNPEIIIQLYVFGIIILLLPRAIVLCYVNSKYKKYRLKNINQQIGQIEQMQNRAFPLISTQAIKKKCCNYQITKSCALYICLFVIISNIIYHIASVQYPSLLNITQTIIFIFYLYKLRNNNNNNTQKLLQYVIKTFIIMFIIYFTGFIIWLCIILKMDEKYIQELGLNMDKTSLIKVYVISNCLMLLPRVIAIGYVVYQDRNRRQEQKIVI